MKVKETTNGICLTIFEAYQAILELEQKDFHKSMTEYFNDHVWQDVYKKRFKRMSMYIKFKIVDGEFFLLSFKLDQNE